MGGAEAFLLESVFADSLWPEHLQLPVSEDNERLALNDVAARVEADLARMPGSLQNDLQVCVTAVNAT